MTRQVISIMGWSGSGKTTLIERLIPLLRQRGLRVGVLKHDGHDFQVDNPRKDSGRYTAAGAEVTAVSCDSHAAIMENRPVDVFYLLSQIRDVDIIIIEGWKAFSFKKIEVNRLANGKERYAESAELAALVTDRTGLDESIPVFAMDDYAGISDFIMGLYHEGELEYSL